MRRVIGMVAPILFVLLAGAQPGQTATDTRVWSSPDGALRFRYPATWYVIDNWDPSTDDFPTITVQNLAPEGREAANGEFIVRFWREPSSGDDTVTSLASRDCTAEPLSRVNSCEIVSINGLKWSWVNTETRTGNAGEGSRARIIATVALGSIYRGLAIAPAGNLQAKGLAETKRILESVVVISQLPKTGLTHWILSWTASLLALAGYAIQRRLSHLLSPVVNDASD